MSRSYQEAITINNLYAIRLKGGESGLAETLTPRITAIGGNITLYGAENEPTALTQANIATKMALIKQDFQIQNFESLPNYIAVIEASGTIAELDLTSIQIEATTAIPA